MDSKYRKSLATIFTDGEKCDEVGARIEALLRAMGCKVIEGSSSSIIFEKDSIRAHFHVHTLTRKPCATVCVPSVTICKLWESNHEHHDLQGLHRPP